MKQRIAAFLMCVICLLSVVGCEHPLGGQSADGHG